MSSWWRFDRVCRWHSWVGVLVCTTRMQHARNVTTGPSVGAKPKPPPHSELDVACTSVRISRSTCAVVQRFTNIMNRVDSLSAFQYFPPSNTRTVGTGLEVVSLRLDMVWWKQQNGYTVTNTFTIVQAPSIHKLFIYTVDPGFVSVGILMMQQSAPSWIFLDASKQHVLTHEGYVMVVYRAVLSALAWCSIPWTYPPSSPLLKYAWAASMLHASIMSRDTEDNTMGNSAIKLTFYTPNSTALLPFFRYPLRRVPP